MRVLLSWSGSTSKAIASVLHSWLPKVIQRVAPQMSSVDISAGAQWMKELSPLLQDSEHCIVVTTPENRNSSWIAFEAGAVANKLGAGRVCPLLVKMQPADLEGPLTQFQAVHLDKAGVQKLLADLNKCLGTGSIGESVLNESFELWWPRLEEQIAQAISRIIPPPPREDRAVLEEVLELCRGLARAQVHERLLVSDYAPVETNIDDNAPAWEKAYARLHSWTCALLNSVRLSYAEFGDTVTSQKELPSGCPSRASLALMVFEPVGEKLGEVRAAYNEVRQTIAAIEGTT